MDRFPSHRQLRQQQQKFQKQHPNCPHQLLQQQHRLRIPHLRQLLQKCQQRRCVRLRLSKLDGIGERIETQSLLTTFFLPNKRLLATNLGVAHLLAIRALHSRVITRLRALSTLMTLGITIATNDLMLISTVLRNMTLFALCLS